MPWSLLAGWSRLDVALAAVKVDRDISARRDKPGPLVCYDARHGGYAPALLFSEIAMCHHRRVSDWFRNLWERFKERMRPVEWDEAKVEPVKVKATRKAKSKRNKK